MTTTTTTSCDWRPRPGAPAPACWVASAGDDEKLALAHATLRHYYIATVPGPDGALDASDDSRTRVVWSDDDVARCLDSDGRLREALTVRLGGAGAERAATAAFERAGLAVRPGPAAGTISVGGPSGEHGTGESRGPGVELSGPAGAAPADLEGLRASLEATPLCLVGYERQPDGAFTLRLATHDGSAPTDQGIAQALAAVAGSVRWVRLTRSGAIAGPACTRAAGGEQR
jgi:hypothetical protein